MSRLLICNLYNETLAAAFSLSVGVCTQPKIICDGEETSHCITSLTGWQHFGGGTSSCRANFRKIFQLNFDAYHRSKLLPT